MPAEPLPALFSQYRDRHRGETVVVCGCGTSLASFERPMGCVTIGVNDVGRRFTPDYLVVVNERRQFEPGRYLHVEQTRAKAVFTQLQGLELSQTRVVRFRLGRRGGTERPDGETLHYANNSPYVAVQLARHLGAAFIGLIGVDFTDGHFFGATGRHPLAGQLAQIDREYAALAAACRADGVELVNLSATSRLSSLPKVDPAAWSARSQSHGGTEAPQPLRIVSYATTPVAGVPAVLARCIAHATAHSARCVWATNGYGNGVSFGGDVEWSRNPREALDLLDGADLVIVHNGHTAAQHRRVLESKIVITMAHNYGWNVDMQWVRRGGLGVVVGQYQATLPEFLEWVVVPNPLPFWEPQHRPGRKGDRITIAYTPSGRHERYPAGHRLYWHGKGFETTMRVLDGLSKRHGIVLETTSRAQVSHTQALQMKQRAHIVIDECVTGSYHRNSLEGLAAGAVVVNGVGALLPAVVDVLARCAPGMDRPPFVPASLETLEEVLESLVGRGAERLADEGRAGRDWIERHWDFAAQWARFWQPVVERALAGPVHAARTKLAPRRLHPAKSSESAMEKRTAAQRVSVVVPHAGADRLPQLAATLVNLRQCPAVLEVIVVELGERPVAAAAAARWADRHLFVEHQGAFERARALNAGSAVADGDLVLWHDNDLLAPHSLIADGVAELNERSLDYLIPYGSIRYLDEDDSRAVMQGQRDPNACIPLNTYYSTRAPSCSGGMGLVRMDFLKRHGGLIEGFRGWGGEDNGWNHKVALLGRAAPTKHPDRIVHHLYHGNSGGHALECARDANAHYAENLRLLARICSTHSEDELRQAFPPTLPARGVLARSSRACANAADRFEPVVWTYWEGPCPAWIRECRRTIARHAPRVRFLDPASFDQLRDRDRDIDLTRLDAAHRADYIRAFLLQRYGGLWLDADCLVMQSLQPVLELLEQHEYVGHRERSGLVSNGFIAARPGSRIAAEHHAQIARILRSRQPVSWTTLGSEPLTAIVAVNSSGWHELRCERVQPVCWSAPEEFFRQRDRSAHERAFDAQAICYMLSNVAVRKYIATHAGADLLHERSFFRYLLAHSLGIDEAEAATDFERIFDANVELYRDHRLESMSGPGSSLAQTSELRRCLPLLIEELGIESLLDAPCGDFNWMQHVSLGGRRYIGVDVHGETVARNRWRHARPDRSFHQLDLMRDPLPRAHAILCRDLLPHLSFAQAFQVLRNFASSGASYLLTTTFTQPRQNRETSHAVWRPLNLSLPPFLFPAPLRLIGEKCTEANGSFADKSLAVWSLADLMPSIYGDETRRAQPRPDAAAVST